MTRLRVIPAAKFARLYEPVQATEDVEILRRQLEQQTFDRQEFDRINGELKRIAAFLCEHCPNEVAQGDFVGLTLAEVVIGRLSQPPPAPAPSIPARGRFRRFCAAILGRP